MTLKRQLKYYLGLRGMTAAELSRRSGVPKQSLSDWLAGVAPRSIPHLKSIADVFGISLDELCFGNSYQEKKVTLTSHFKHEYPPILRFSELSIVLNKDSLILELNPEFEKLLGWSPLELKHQPLTQFIHPGDRFRLRELILQPTQGGSALFCSEYRVVSKWARIKWVRFHARVYLSLGLISLFGEEITCQFPPEEDYAIHLCLRQLVTHKIKTIEYLSSHASEGRSLFMIKEVDCNLDIRCYPVVLSVSVFSLMYLLSLKTQSVRAEPLLISLKSLKEHCEIEFESNLEFSHGYLAIPTQMFKNHFCKVGFYKGDRLSKIRITVPRQIALKEMLT